MIQLRSLAQTALILMNGKVEQKHSDESECLKINLKWRVK